MDMGVSPQPEMRATWVRVQKLFKNPTLIGAKFVKRVPLKGLVFLTNFEFWVLIFVKIFKMPPLWVQKLLNPTLFTLNFKISPSNYSFHTQTALNLTFHTQDASKLKCYFKFSFQKIEFSSLKLDHIPSIS